MASTPASEMIFFIAALAISSTIAAFMFSTVGDTSSIFSQEVRSMADTIRDDITIINDPNSVTNDPVIIYVKNTGSSTLPVDTKIADVIINGTYQTNYSMVSLSGNAEWEPSDVVKFTINTSLSSGSNTIRIYVRGNEWDEMKFRI